MGFSIALQAIEANICMGLQMRNYGALTLEGQQAMQASHKSTSLNVGVKKKDQKKKVDIEA